MVPTKNYIKSGVTSPMRSSSSQNSSKVGFSANLSTTSPYWSISRWLTVISMGSSDIGDMIGGGSTYIGTGTDYRMLPRWVRVSALSRSSFRRISIYGIKLLPSAALNASITLTVILFENFLSKLSIVKNKNSMSSSDVCGYFDMLYAKARKKGSI